MLEIGKTVSLEVLRTLPIGLILASGEHEILLPTRYVPRDTRAGDFLEVFLYTDSEDRPIATTEKPLAEIDEFACLKVVSLTASGAFLDWGLPKDILLPFKNQLHRVQPEERVVVRVLLDRISGRPVASSKVERFLEPPPIDLREGRAVRLLIYEETKLGSKAIVDGRYPGLLYWDRIQRQPEIGASLEGFVQRIRADGKVDLTLTPSGRAGADVASDIVIRALVKAGGRLDLTDQSPPADIREALGLSKRAFKRAVGGLYRQRRIRLHDESIELVDSSPQIAGPENRSESP